MSNPQETRPSVQKGMKKKQYTMETLIAAIDAVKQGMSKSMASKKFGIPRMTLTDKVKQKTPLIPKQKTVLSKEEEEKLVTWILAMGRQGMGRTSLNICSTVQSILNGKDPIPRTTGLVGHG